MKKTIVNLSTLSATLAAILLATGVSQAGDDGLTAWGKSASIALEEAMETPRILGNRTPEGSLTFRVTIDGDGELVSFSKKESNGHPALARAARKVIKTADFPAPAEYLDRDRLTFAVQLNYDIVTSMREKMALERKARTTTRQIAGAQAPLSASIRVLDSSE